MDVRIIKNKAFTLLELLVVIAIIAMLLVIVVPVLARAKEQGRGLYCQNNLHQMYLAAMVYTESHKGFFPIAYYKTNTTSGINQYCWDFTVRRNSGGDIIDITPGVLWQGEATIEKIQQCPSFKNEQSDTTNDLEPYTGYNYNTSYVGHGQLEAGRPDRWNQMRRPAYCILFGDGEYVNDDTSGPNKYMRSPLPSDSDGYFVGRWAGTQGFRHNQSTNLIRCDGAVSSGRKVFTGSDVD
jgi:prepilin-type N-terminal cleavage/methylation domain-containing protein